MNKAVLYTTVEADRLDLIAYRHYGRVSGTVEAILAANPRLSMHATQLPSGMRILLPAPPAAVDADQVILWS